MSSCWKGKSISSSTKDQVWTSLWCSVLLYFLWTRLISESTFLQIHGKDTILISSMTFRLMVHISKDFNKKNIILWGAFRIDHKELIYKSGAFVGEHLFNWDRKQGDVCGLQWQEAWIICPCSHSLSSGPTVQRHGVLMVKIRPEIVMQYVDLALPKAWAQRVSHLLSLHCFSQTHAMSPARTLLSQVTEPGQASSFLKWSASSSRIPRSCPLLF